MKKVLRQDLAAAVAEVVGNGKALEAVDRVIGRMVKAFEDGDSVEIRGFGTFKVTLVAPRIGRNPRTGEAVSIPARKKVRFKQSTILNTDT